MRELKHAINTRQTGFFHNRTTALSIAVLLCVAPLISRAAENPKPKSEEELRREAAIAAFTQRMKDSNYPALFQKAADEFKVPADILKGVAFAETRWEHFQWPPGETRSPETGMPRPFGIMSLMDNEFFGHSLTEAAKLIGKDPQELKDDPLQNIRGAAALLKKIYGENPKPEGTTEADIESWRNAIVKYCGIPEPDLSNQHALDVYIFMSRGYHQYGIEWEARSVNIEPMRAEVRKIVAEEKRKKEQKIAALETNTAAVAAPPNSSPQIQSLDTNILSPSLDDVPVPVNEPPSKSSTVWNWIILALVIVLGIRMFLAWRKSKGSSKP